MISKRVVLFVFFLVFLFSIKGEAQNYLPTWSYTNTSLSHTFNFPVDVIICSEDTLEIGDYIGVFYDSLGILSCAGYFIWNGGNQDLIAYGDDTTTTVKEGFSIDEEVTWKSFQVDVGLEYIHQAIYAHEPYYPDSGHFVENGASQLVYLGNCIEPVFEVFAGQTSCYNTNDGYAWLEVLEFNPPYSYLWSTGSINDSIENLSTGYYNVTVTNALGYQSIDSILVTEPDSISLVFYPNHVSEVGVPNGSIDLSPSGGTAPYSYLWNNGSTNEDLNNVFAGEYAVIITDSNGCTNTDSIELLTIVPLPWTVEETSHFHKVLFMSGINIFVSDFSMQQGDFIGAFYDSLGIQKCAGTLYFDNNSLENDSVVRCFGDLDSTLGKEGFAPNEPFNWKIWDSSTGNEIMVFPTYTVTPDWPNQGFFVAEGHSAIGTITDIEHDLGISAWLSPTGYCNLSNSETVSLEIYSSGMISDYFFNVKYNINGGPWYTETIIDTLSYQDTVQVNLSTPANLGSAINYHLTAVVQGINDMVSANDTFEIDIFPIQSTVSSIPDTMSNCVGEAGVVVSGGTAPYTYLWNDPDSQQTETAINLCTGIFEVTITDSLNCQITETLSVPNALPPSYDYVFSNIDCYGSSNAFINISMLNFVFPLQFEWSNGSYSEDLYNIQPGIYTLTITDGTGLSVYDTFNISQPDSLYLTSITSDLMCWGDIDGSINIEVNGGTEPYQFNWSNGETTEDIANLQAADYVVTVSDANQCQIISVFTLSQPDPIGITSHVFHVSTANAYDGGINISTNGGTLPYSFMWSNGMTSEDIYMLGSGVYSLTLTDNNNCQETYGPFIINEPYPVISGQVFMGPNLLNYGIAVLYKKSTNDSFDAINYTTINNGQYSFTVNNQDSFLIYAIPPFDFDINFYPIYFPTYYGNTLKWQNSSCIKTLADIDDANIYLSSYDSVFYGQASVSGHISYINSYDYETLIFDNDWFNMDTYIDESNTNPARNIPLFLLDENNLVVAYCLSYNDGSFAFNNVESGTYTLFAEKAGFISHHYSFVINEEDTSISGIPVFILDKEIYLSDNSDLIDNDSEFKVYPNPVKDVLFIKISNNTSRLTKLSIYNSIGAELQVYKQSSLINSNLIQLKTESLKSGIYFVSVKYSNGQSSSQKFVIP